MKPAPVLLVWCAKQVSCANLGLNGEMKEMKKYLKTNSYLILLQKSAFTSKNGDTESNFAFSISPESERAFQFATCL